MATTKAVRTITRAIQKLYPPELADSAWDNTGLLLGALADESADNAKLSVLLTIDLTTSVVDEALKKHSNFIVAYHPFIFRGLKSITPEDSQQKSLLRLARAGVAVYCPHTAVDAAVGGVNDWLADGISGGTEHEIERKVVTPVQGVENHEGAGMGRLVTLKKPVPFDELVRRVKTHLGLAQLQVAVAPHHRSKLALISSVAMCAGSGDSVLRGVKADVHFTGEVGHHTALHLVENGASAIVCGHSNTERGFLKVLQKQLSKELRSIYEGPSEVCVSETDRDPLEIV